MTYGYKYHDKDGSVKVGEISAPCREDAFQSLHASGIKPMQFWSVESSAPPRRFGKRGLAIVVLCAVCLVLGSLLFSHDARGTRHDARSTKHEARGTRREALPLPRKQLADFPTNLVAVFAHPSECYLAAYAQPGLSPSALRTPHQARSTSHEARSTSLSSLADDLYEALEDPIWIESTDASAVIELKRIVAGLKEDARKFLNTADGVRKLETWLDERQRMEAAYRASILSGPGTENEKDAKLKAMGLR